MQTVTLQKDKSVWLVQGLRVTVFTNGVYAADAGKWFSQSVSAAQPRPGPLSVVFVS
jgi:hypothetical protein